ncbi:uncharacterized protein LOC114538589 isoform X2 [Dendronephthya gigantea]|uniref:uncharacterized protein LOC114538589 isoform X2 n=1 Tax=Dendronephthya gigantea TaxID=151771 RepID=UPI00106A3505|nr:uncharacterized protein LOC114538589 isoform X2 [Dendronephthya gigantea]
MGQDSSKLSSKRRVEHGEKTKLLSKDHHAAAMKLSTSEVNTLKQLYHRLAALSPEDEYINKQTFLNYFPLEGILAERLFATFDKDKNNVIDLEEFLGGLALCLAGTVDEKFQLVFDLYNIDDGDGISEEELAIVLKSTLIAARAIVGPIKNSTLDEEVVKELFDVDEHVKKVVHDAFEQCDTSQTGKLSPEEFRNWAEQHSYILDIIFGHKSFTDKQKISLNITAAAIKAAEINSVRCQSQTWIDSPNTLENQIDNHRGYSKATYLWSPVFPVMLKAPKARSEHTACVYQGSLYVLGGRGACSAFKDFWKYDLALNNWSELPNVDQRPSHIFGHTAVLYKGSMYIYGGEFESCETFVWKYTFDNNNWEKMSFSVLPNNKAPMNRRYHSAVVYQKKMFVFGGLIEIRGSTDELWTFDLEEHTWERLSQSNAALPGKRYEHSAVVYNRAMWIAGGLEVFVPRNDVWKWEFEKSTWCKIKSRGGPFPIRGHRAVRCGNGMLVYGGSTNGEHQNKVWRLEFESLSWNLVTPHGGVSPPARSSAALVILSAFSLPLLPPQMVNTADISTTKSRAKTSIPVEEERPHTSPGANGNQKITPSSERRARHCSVSTDSVYRPSSLTPTDKRCSAGSLDNLEKNFVAFTNACYSSSSEWQVDKNNIYPLHRTFHNRSHSLERHEEEGPQNEGTAGANEHKLNKNMNYGDDTCTRASQNIEVSHPKEGLCIFVIGGKYCGSHDCFAKGVDIWRCDVTKRWKRKTKIRKIKVETADTASIIPSVVTQQTDASFATFNEQSSSRIVNPSRLGDVRVSPINSSRKLFSSACRQDVLRMSDRQVKVEDRTEGENVESYYGDLVVTDLGSLNEPVVND